MSAEKPNLSLQSPQGKAPAETRAIDRRLSLGPDHLLLEDRIWDVIVIGAGPAGSLAARQLAVSGSQVLLLDRATFPRSKVCGGCVNGAALSLMLASGLDDLDSLRTAPALSELQLRGARRKATVHLPGGRAVSRDQLDSDLAKAAVAAGATFVHETTASLHRFDGRSWTVGCRRGSDESLVRGRIVLVATGLGPIPATVPGDHAALDSLRSTAAAGARIGLGAVVDLQDETEQVFRRGTIYMNHDAAGYVGLVRLAGDRLDIAAALNAEALKGHATPHALVTGILQRVGLPVPHRLGQALWKGTPPLTQRPSRLAADRLLLIGDAAGYVEPFTGEGISWALASGWLAAELVCQTGDAWSPEVANRWQQLHWRHVGRRQRVCRWVARVLRSHGLSWWMTAGLAWMPRLARPVVRALNEPFDVRAGVR